MSPPSSARTKVAGRREQDALATREALLAAAAKLFTARGYAEVGTEEVVRTIPSASCASGRRSTA